jgi:hypothetical protein
MDTLPLSAIATLDAFRFVPAWGNRMIIDQDNTDQRAPGDNPLEDTSTSSPETPRDPAAAGTWLMNPVYMILAVAAFAILIGVTLAIIRNREGGGQLAGALMTLELRYPLTSEPVAFMDGQRGAAPSGALVICRTVAQPHLRLGEGTADADGSFRVELDPSPWPLDSLGSDLYNQLNSSIECRADRGDWVRPLRPPRVSVA